MIDITAADTDLRDALAAFSRVHKKLDETRQSYANVRHQIDSFQLARMFDQLRETCRIGLNALHRHHTRLTGLDPSDNSGHPVVTHSASENPTPPKIERADPWSR